MSIVINLPKELERPIAAEAANAGMTASDYVADRLAKATAVTATGETKVRLTGAALVQRWRDLGLIGYRSDITDVATYTTLNGSSLMDGSTTSVSVQVGIAAGDSRSLSFSSATAAALGLSALDISTSASTAIDTIDTALVTIGNYQSLVGSHEKLMDYRETLSDNMILSLTSAYGNVMDADVAAETTNLATYQIRQEAAAAVLVQSNTITKEMVAYLLQSVTS